MRICFVGAPGSGKTTLSTQVFTALKQSGRSAELVDEWVREDIHRHGPMTTIWEQYRTRQHQKELEDAVPNNVDFVVCDSGSLSSYFYAVLYADAKDPRQRIVLQDMHRYLLDDLFLGRYDLIFYVPSMNAPDLTDGTRYQTEREVRVLDQHMKMVFTQIYQLPSVHIVSETLDRRFQQVMWRILGTADPAREMSTIIAEVSALSENQ